MNSFGILDNPVKPPPPLELAVCPHCRCAEAWVYHDPVSGPEVICECLFGVVPHTQPEIAHAPHPTPRPETRTPAGGGAPRAA